MPDPVESRLADLPTLSKEALADLWKQFFGSTPPTQLRRNLMISILAYRIQERTFTSLNGRVRSRLIKLAHAFETNPDVKSASMPRLRPGTRLVRQWSNQVHLVNVESHGFEYKGGRYKSLSEIARLITGTRWSGPLFFGIKNEQSGSKLEESQ
jgi:Protein of unknown function (DUF2924)